MLKIRRFRPADAEECSRIEREIQRRLFSRIYPKKVTAHFLRGSSPRRMKKKFLRRITFVAEQDGNIRGFLVMIAKKRVAKISSLFVRFDQRRTGIGRKLMDFAVSFLRKNFPKVRKVWLRSSLLQPTITFYKAMGFNKIARKTISFPGKIRLVFILMEKNLP